MSWDNASPADIAAITGCNGNNRSGFLDDIIALAVLGMFFGGGMWGNAAMMGGYGGGYGGGIPTNYVLSSDFSNIERKIDGVNNGLCDGFYAQNTNMLNGFSGVQNTLAQGFAGINTALTREGYENRIATNAVGTQLASCCCDVRGDISALNYNVANQATGLGNTVTSGLCDLGRSVERGFADANYVAATNATAIIQNQHNDTDRVLAKLYEMESTRKDEKFAALQAENQSLRFAQSQAEQNAYLIDKLGYHCPQAAYVVQPPQPVTFPTGCGCGTGCG